MNTKTNISQLRDAAFSQWGMFTTAQANSFEVSRQQLYRACKSGSLERVSHGVYRFLSGADTSFIEVKAAWLEIYPDKLAYDRLITSVPDAIVTGRTAASLYEVGDLYADPYTFATPVRKQTSRKNIRYITSEVDREDRSIVQDLPCASPARTLVDMIRVHEDPSLVHDVAVDFENKNIQVDTVRLAYLLAPLAHRNGYTKGDGNAFVDGIFDGYNRLKYMRARDKALRDDKKHVYRIQELQASLLDLYDSNSVISSLQNKIDKMRADGKLDAINNIQRQFESLKTKNSDYFNMIDRLNERIRRDPEFAEAIKTATIATPATEEMAKRAKDLAEKEASFRKSRDNIIKAAQNAKDVVSKYSNEGFER